MTVSAGRMRMLLLGERLADALTEARRAVALGASGWLDRWAMLLESVVDVLEAAAAERELRSALDELADAYRRKGNLVALERAERRVAALGDGLGTGAGSG